MPWQRQASSSGIGTTELTVGLFALALVLLLAGSVSGVPQAREGGLRAGSLEAEIPVFAGGTPPYADTDYLDGRLRPAGRGRNAGRPAPPSRPGESHPEPLTEPCVTVSSHTARATLEGCRLPS